MSKEMSLKRILTPKHYTHVWMLSLILKPLTKIHNDSLHYSGQAFRSRLRGYVLFLSSHKSMSDVGHEFKALRAGSPSAFHFLPNVSDRAPCVISPYCFTSAGAAGVWSLSPLSLTPTWIWKLHSARQQNDPLHHSCGFYSQKVSLHLFSDCAKYSLCAALTRHSSEASDSPRIIGAAARTHMELSSLLCCLYCFAKLGYIMAGHLTLFLISSYQNLVWTFSGRVHKNRGIYGKFPVVVSG